jgi:hypothetical protein
MFRVPIIIPPIRAFIAGAKSMIPLSYGIFPSIANLKDVIPPIESPVKKIGI